MFLHSGLLHVVFNMWALWDAGRVAERLFGRWRYLALYTVAGILGGIASINWQQDFVGVGASGAVFGVYGGLLAGLLLRPDMLPATVAKQLQASATVFILYSLFNGFTHAGIDNAAHLGGLIAGALVGAALVMPSRRALAAMATALVLIGGGAVRAIEAAEPYRDELAFRQFMNSFAPAETRLNAIAADLGKRAKTLPPEEFLRVLERDVIPGWIEQDTRIAALPNVTPRNRRCATTWPDSCTSVANRGNCCATASAATTQAESKRSRRNQSRPMRRWSRSRRALKTQKRASEGRRLDARDSKSGQ
jgi:rhomboid protease GluP